MKLKEMIKKVNTGIKTNKKRTQKIETIENKLNKIRSKLDNINYEKTNFKIQSVEDCGEGFNLSIVAAVRLESYYNKEVETVVEYILYSTKENEYYSKLPQLIDLPEKVFENMKGAKRLVDEWLNEEEDWPFEELSDDKYCAKLFSEEQ